MNKIRIFRRKNEEMEEKLFFLILFFWKVKNITHFRSSCLRNFAYFFSRRVIYRCNILTFQIPSRQYPHSLLRQLSFLTQSARSADAILLCIIVDIDLWRLVRGTLLSYWRCICDETRIRREARIESNQHPAMQWPSYRSERGNGGDGNSEKSLITSALYFCHISAPFFKDIAKTCDSSRKRGEQKNYWIRTTWINFLFK